MKRSLQIATAVFLWLVLSTGEAAPATTHHVFLVDTSGSMAARSGGRKSPSQIDLARAAVLRFLSAPPPQSRFYLASFDVDRSEPVTVELGKSEATGVVEQWFAQAKKQVSKGKSTNLWTSLRDFLPKLLPILNEHEEDTITLHVLTDGLDTERVTDLDRVIKEIPQVDAKSIKRGVLVPHDVEMTLSQRTAVDEKPKPDATTQPPPEKRHVERPKVSLERQTPVLLRDLGAFTNSNNHKCFAARSDHRYQEHRQLRNCFARENAWRDHHKYPGKY